MKDMSLKIAINMMMGGLVVAPRGSGKTKALCYLLKEDCKAVVIVNLESQRHRFIKMLTSLHGFSEENAGRKVLHSKSSILKESTMLVDKNVYVDELYLNEYKGPFKAAVSSFPYKIKVIG